MDHSFRDRKEALHGLLLETRSFVAELGHTRSADQLEETATQLLEGRLFLVLCGEIKQGKSSLLGALLEDPELFPIDTDIATSRLTMVRYADEERLQVVVGPPGETESKSIRRDQIANHITARGNPDNQLDVRWLQIETPNPRLQDGLVVVDTPGISDVDPSHIEVTVGLLPRADLVLFVSDALAPLSQPELDFLSGHVAEATTEIIFVLTKVDQVIDVDAILESNRHKLSQTLGIGVDAITILPVSSLSKLRFMDSNDPEDLADSGFPELEVELERRLHGRKGTILLRQAMVRFDHLIDQLQGPMAAELRACRRDHQERAERSKQEIETILDRLRELNQKDPHWREALLRGFRSIQQQVLGREYPLEEARLQQLLDAELEEENNLVEPQALLAHMEAAVARTCARLVRQIHHRTRSLIEQVEKDTLLPWDAGPLATGSPRSADLELPAVTPEAEGVWSQTVDVSRFAAMGSMGGGLAGLTAGAILGGLLGLVTGGPAGAVAGAKVGGSIGSSGGTLGGLFTGFRKGRRALQDRQRTAARKEVRSLIAPSLRESLIQLRAILDEALTRIRDSILDGFEERLKQEKQTLEQAIAGLEAARQLSAAEALERARTLEQQIAWLESRRQAGRQVVLPETQDQLSGDPETSQEPDRVDGPPHA